MGQPFSWKRQVEFCETDAAGIVHFSSLIVYMEQAEHALLRSVGLSVAPSATSSRATQPLPHLSWPRVRVECDFAKPARFEDLLVVHVGIAAIGGKSITYESRITRDNDTIATGKIVSVCSRHSDEGLRSTEIPDAIRKLLSPFTLFDE